MQRAHVLLGCGSLQKSRGRRKKGQDAPDSQALSCNHRRWRKNKRERERERKESKEKNGQTKPAPNGRVASLPRFRVGMYNATLVVVDVFASPIPHPGFPSQPTNSAGDRGGDEMGYMIQSARTETKKERRQRWAGG